MRERPGPGYSAEVITRTVRDAVERAGATYLERTTGTPITHVEVDVDGSAAVDDK